MRSSPMSWLPTGAKVDTYLGTSCAGIVILTLCWWRGRNPFRIWRQVCDRPSVLRLMISHECVRAGVWLKLRSEYGGGFMGMVTGVSAYS